MTRRSDKQKERKASPTRRGSVAADLTQQVPRNTYDLPVTAYYDQAFTCVVCGADEIWLAEDQKWYFEVAKGSLYGQAKRCRGCRKKIRAEKSCNKSRCGNQRNHRAIKGPDYA